MIIFTEPSYEGCKLTSTGCSKLKLKCVVLNGCNKQVISASCFGSKQDDYPLLQLHPLYRLYNG